MSERIDLANIALLRDHDGVELTNNSSERDLRPAYGLDLAYAHGDVPANTVARSIETTNEYVASMDRGVYGAHGKPPGAEGGPRARRGRCLRPDAVWNGSRHPRCRPACGPVSSRPGPLDDPARAEEMPR